MLPFSGVAGGLWAADARLRSSLAETVTGSRRTRVQNTIRTMIAAVTVTHFAWFGEAKNLQKLRQILMISSRGLASLAVVLQLPFKLRTSRRGVRTERQY